MMQKHLMDFQDFDSCRPAVRWFTKDELVKLLVRRKLSNACYTVERGLATLRMYQGEPVPGMNAGVPENLEEMLNDIVKDVDEQTSLGEFVSFFQKRVLAPAAGWQQLLGYRYSAEEGRFPRRRRMNADQVEIKFPVGGLMQRKLTLQIAMTGEPSDPQPPITLIFQGKGFQISTDETAQYHRGARVLWQHHGLMDDPTMKAWVGSVLSPYLKDHYCTKQAACNCASLFRVLCCNSLVLL